MPLSVSAWKCLSCNTTPDREANAAITLRSYAVSCTVSVYGGEGAGLACKKSDETGPFEAGQRSIFQWDIGVSFEQRN